MDTEGATTSRRRFLGTAAGATGVALAATVWNPAQARAATPLEAGQLQPVGRSYVTGHFVLNLDGVRSGFLKSSDGGSITATVVEEAAGADYFRRKHLGTVKYEDFTLQLGFAMNKAVYDWIAATWQMNYQRKNGAIIAADYNMDATSQREFFDALITETGIPACDGASKEPAYLTIKLAPELTRTTKAGGSVKGDVSKGTSQKTWLPSNFRLEIDGLDCTRVNKVEAFTVKQTVAQDSIGDARDYLREPGRLEFPNLKISLAQTGAQTWFDWHEDFVIRGNCGDDKEKSGRLVFLSPDRQTELAEVKFFGLGIFKLADGTFEANDDAVARVQAELYCERMEFHYKAGAIG